MNLPYLNKNIYKCTIYKTTRIKESLWENNYNQKISVIILIPKITKIWHLSLTWFPFFGNDESMNPKRNSRGAISLQSPDSTLSEIDDATAMAQFLFKVQIQPCRKPTTQQPRPNEIPWRVRRPQLRWDSTLLRSQYFSLLLHLTENFVDKSLI